MDSPSHPDSALEGRDAPSERVGGIPRFREGLTREPIPGNRARLLEDATATFPEMLAAIGRAQDHVHVEAFRIQSDSTGWRFAQALVERARAGVEVRLLADAVGSIFCSPSLFAALRAAGGRTALYRPIELGRQPRFWHRRDHRKIIVVDGTLGFLGGSNLCDEHQPTAEGGAVWRDTNVAIEGPAVRELAKVFRSAWWSATGELLPGRRYLPRIAALGNHGVAVLSNREWRQRHQIRRAHVRAFRRARFSIHLTQAYFLPDRGLQRALFAAAKRGVDVRVLLGGLSDVPAVQLATRHLYGRLISRGVRIHEWPDRVLHAKTACIDGRWSMIGSYNLDHRSFRHNLEVVAMVAGTELGAAMETLFQRDLARSPPVDLERWRRRSWWQRLQGAFWHSLRHWL